MTKDKAKEKSSISLIRKIGLIVIGLVLLYVIAGFWVIPSLLKPRLESELSSQIGRKVTIEEFKLNPLMLSSTTTNLTVYENDGEPFAGFKELLVDAELSSIIRWAVTFKEIRLEAPFGVIKVLSDKTLNISDILTRFSQPEPEPEEQAGLPRAVISKLQVADGKFTVEDLTGAEPVIETLAPITFTLINLSTFAEREGAFKFTGIGPLGGNYQLNGQLSVNPIRVQGSYSTNGTHLSRLWEHIKEQVSFQIQSGTTATSGNYLLELIDGKLHAKLQQGVFELKDFQLTEKGKDEVLISIPSFSVQGASVDVKAREIVVEQVKTADARIETWLNSDGTFNLQSLFMPDLQKLAETKKSDSTEPKTDENSPWHVTIGKIEADNWGATIEDRTLPKPLRFTVDDFTVRIENLATKENSKAKIALAFQIKEVAAVKVEGSAGIDPMAADLVALADKIVLKSFQPYVDMAVNAGIASGTASTKGRILYQSKDDKPHINLKEGVFILKDVQVTEKGQDQVLIAIPSFTVQGIGADVAAREVVVEQVKTADARIESWLEPDGTFNLQRLLKPDAQPSEEKKKAASAEPPKSADKPSEETKDAGKPWYATIHQIQVDDWGAAIEDRTLPEPVRLTVDDVTVRVEDLTTKKNSKAKVALALQLNQAGTLKVNGSAVIDPLSADVEVLTDKLELKSFQPYVGQQVKAQIASGTTSSKGRLLYQDQGGQPQIRYQGELSLDGVEIKGRRKGDNLITLQQFKASGIDLDIHPNKLHVADALIHKTDVSLTVDPNGSVNVVDSFTPVEKEDEKGKENLIAKFINFLIFQVKGEVPVNIELVRVEDFAVDFSDESIQPPFSTDLVITKASMKNLSSDLSARGDFKIAGTIDQSATVGSVGQMNPFNAMNSAQVDLSLKDFNLPSVTPYAAKYVGYKIAEGKLHLNLKYRVAEHKFTGDNQILVAQMALGDPVESEVAHPVLVKMGIALLTGGDGNITLQVPVSGDINDPQFDFGQTAISALTGAMTDLSKSQASADTGSSPAATGTDSSPASAGTDSSPALIRADIEDIKGEEVRFIEFEFGLSELNAHAMKKLDALAKFLNEKPDLKLGIEGTADRQMDRVKDQAIDDKQLTMLALTRANLVKNYLIRNGKVAAGRLHLAPGKIISITDKEYILVVLHLSGQ